MTPLFDDRSDIVIAYEPVWAIGTGLTAVSTPFRPPFSTHLVPAGLPTLSSFTVAVVLPLSNHLTSIYYHHFVHDT
jgi:hypothetical protein